MEVNEQFSITVFNAKTVDIKELQVSLLYLKDHLKLKVNKLSNGYIVNCKCIKTIRSNSKYEVITILNNRLSKLHKPRK